MDKHFRDLVLHGRLETTLPEVRDNRGYLVAKRCFDAAFAAAVVTLGLPFFAAVALAIRIDSPGPIFFRQRRVGRHGKTFTIYKFRSMYVNTPHYAVTPLDEDLDPRITRVGRYLRKSRLDETPQFFNVLRGDMSLVGPRPEMPFIVEEYTPRLMRRLSVTPGVTGLWQIGPNRHKAIHDHPEDDEHYLEIRNFWLDLAIIGKTFLFTLDAMLRALRRHRP